MADLQRKLNILQHLSPAISEKQPRTQTKCGGLLMMTLFPVAVIISPLPVLFPVVFTFLLSLPSTLLSPPPSPPILS